MPLTDHDIARWRLRSQQLVDPLAARPLDVVRSLLAVQAENPRQSAWAVACRADDPRGLDALLDRGAVLRTHVLRPTWHYVAAEDLGWLLDVTAPRVLAVTGRQLATVHALDRPSLDRATTIVLEALTTHPDQPRSALAATLAEHGFDGGGQFVMILLAHLELQQSICSGRSIGKGRTAGDEHTYAVFDQRVPETPRPDREEGLARLALRYVLGHGPVTAKDLAYWATLTLTDARRGLAAVADQVASFEHEGRTFWHRPGEEPGAAGWRAGPGEPGGHLLQVLDEMYRGYQDSRWVLDARGVVPRGRETAIGMALVDGRLVASMRRRTTATEAVFEIGPYAPLSEDERAAIDAAAARYADYLGLNPRIVLAPVPSWPPESSTADASSVDARVSHAAPGGGAVDGVVP